jgi:UDP-2-acetamido-2-deoxy-ribo-hexuluronate aminotransferase
LNRPIPFVDVQATMEVHGAALEEALGKVIRSGQFINGPEVRELEERLARRVHVDHAIACGSGTDAEVILLLACGIKPGDEVIVPNFTFIATAEAVASIGAHPVCVDVDPRTFTMDPSALREALGPRVRAVVAVSLFGQPAAFEEIETLCADADVICLEDACQSLGSRRRGRTSGSFGHASFTSFYPSKPLGGIGDGGMIFTDDPDLAARCRSLREHGQVGRHIHHYIGMNSRLDSLQAAALLVKLRTFDQEVTLRHDAARRYDETLRYVVQTPHVVPGCYSSYAQYTIRLEDRASRDGLLEYLDAIGVPTALHYPLPIHAQESLRPVLERVPETPVARELCDTVVSLPLSAYIAQEDQERVIAGILAWSELGNAAAAGS